MKTILILFSTVLLGVNPFTTTENSKEAFTEHLTFDAYEGGYFFFTDGDNEPRILEIDATTSINGKLLTKNDNVGLEYLVHYKTVDKSKDSSSDGIILHLEVIE
jgi:hypothetical protein